jgi:hypothetical protein
MVIVSRGGATAAFDESLAIRRKLAAADPGNAAAQRGVSLSLDRIGDLSLAKRDRAAAYEESLAIRRKLTAADPDNMQWHSDLVISLLKVSTVSEPPQARAVLREGLAIVEMLARNGKLTSAQHNWPQLIRNALANLPPEQAAR